MKKYLKCSILTCVVLINTVFAQKASVKFYPLPSKTEKSPGVFNIDLEQEYTSDEDYSYKRKIVDNSSKTFFIEKIQKNNNQVIWRKEIVLTPEDKKAKAEILRLETIEGGFALFVRKKDNVSKAIVITARKLDKNLLPVGDEEIVYTQKSKDEGYTVLSKHGKHFIICCYVSQWSYKNVPFNYKVIDEGFNTVWEKSIIPSEKLYHRLVELTLDRELNLVALFKVSTNGKELSLNGYDQDYMMVGYKVKNDEVKVRMLNIMNKMKVAYGVTSKFDTIDNAIRFYGTYHKTKVNAGAEGVFDFAYSMESFESVYSNFIPYSKEILDKYSGYNYKEGKYPETIEVRNRIREDDNGATFILEDYFEISKQYSSGGLYYTYYHYNNFYIMKTSSYGEVEWTQHIERTNNTVQSYTPYYKVYSFKHNGIIYLVFNTSEATAQLANEIDGYTQDYKDNKALMIFGYDEEGEKVMQQHILSPNSNKKHWCNIEGIKQKNGELGLTFDMPDGAGGKVSSKINAAVVIE